jgi:transcriptional regulator GlxA family with amidase domain
MLRSKNPLILLLAAENTSASVLYGLYDVLYSVGTVYTDMTLGAPAQEILDVRIVSKDGQTFRCLAGIAVEPHCSIKDVATADAVVVCDMYSPVDKAPLGQYAEIAAWLLSMHRQGVLIASVCSGALVLAEAGLLDGREAAAHWAYTELFERSYPNVRMRQDHVLCLSEEPEGIVTAGGVTSWQDLALHLISRFCGHRHACETAKVHLLSGHESGQLPFAVLGRRTRAADPAIAVCQDWILKNYTMPHPIKYMAKCMGLNIRTLSRRFRAATGLTPIDYVQCIRVEEAKRLLEEAWDPVDDVGAQVGYDDPTSFRRIFSRKVGLSPAAYRRRFCTRRPYAVQHR